MAVDTCNISAVNMDKLSAGSAFQVEMLMTAFVLDILIAGSGRAVHYIFTNQTLFHKLVQLTVNSRRTHRCSFVAEERAYLTDIGMSVLIFFKKGKKAFFLFSFISIRKFHSVLQNENDFQF